MKLLNSVAENNCRNDLINSKKYLLESEKGLHVINHIKKNFGNIKSIYALSHTPEQGEDIFRFLLNGEKVIGFDLQDEAGRFDILNITSYSIKEYQHQLKGKVGKLKLAIALDLSKKEMQEKIYKSIDEQFQNI